MALSIPCEPCTPVRLRARGARRRVTTTTHPCAGQRHPRNRTSATDRGQCRSPQPRSPGNTTPHLRRRKRETAPFALSVRPGLPHAFVRQPRSTGWTVMEVLMPQPSTSTEFGEELRRRRLNAGLSLTALSSAVHYSKAQLSKVERGI